MAKADPARVEWIVGIMSAGVVALMLGFLALHAVRGAAALPELSITRQPAPGTAQLRFVVGNDSARSARDVTVALRLRGPDGSETRTLTIDFVPARSEVTGAFLLDGAAETLDYDLRVESYLDP